MSCPTFDPRRENRNGIFLRVGHSSFDAKRRRALGRSTCCACYQSRSPCPARPCSFHCLFCPTSTTNGCRKLIILCSRTRIENFSRSANAMFQDEMFSPLRRSNANSFLRFYSIAEDLWRVFHLFAGCERADSRRSIFMQNALAHQFWWKRLPICH